MLSGLVIYGRAIDAQISQGKSCLRGLQEVQVPSFLLVGDPRSVWFSLKCVFSLKCPVASRTPVAPAVPPLLHP